MEPKPTLRLTFDAGYGESFTMVVPLSSNVAEKCQRVPPPSEMPFASAGMEPFEEVVEMIWTRQFRKDLFMDQARNLGALLAERMEDAEGWHDLSRVEPAKRELKQ